MKWLIVLFFVVFCFAKDDMPLPWTERIYLKSPPFNGDQIIILQNLLLRSKYVSSFVVNGVYDTFTANAVSQFQKGSGIVVPDTIFEKKTADTLLKLHTDDNYVDDGMSASSLGFKYKIIIPVVHNRSIETTASLLDSDNNLVMSFTARTHGVSIPGGAPFPDYNNTSPGLCQFCSNGNTPTGLMEIDLNSPEGQPKFYGPYPVNRVVQGLRGNGGFLIPTIRDGILIHTGEYPHVIPTMPNSHGCIHAHPEDIEKIWQNLVKLGVTVNNNTFGKLPYPFQPQGLLSIYLKNN